MPEAIAIILDIGSHMQIAPPDADTPLHCATECLKLLLQRIIFAEKKDEISLILCGTDASDNHLVDDHGNFANISIVRPLSTMDWDLLEFLNKDFDPITVNADLVDAIIVAGDHLRQQCKGKKGIQTKRILLLSNLAGSMNNGMLQRIVKKLKQEEITMTLVGVCIPTKPEDDDDDDDDDDNEGANDSRKKVKKEPDSHPVEEESNGGEHSSDAAQTPAISQLDEFGKMKSQHQINNEKLLQEILIGVGGEAYSFNDTLPILGFFETREVLQRAWKADLEISDSLSLPLAAYTKIRQAKAKSMKNVYARDPDEDIEHERTYHKQDETETEVDKENTVRGYHYGNTLVPFSEEDMSSLKVKYEKSLKLICFTKSSNCPRHLSTGEGVLTLVSSDSHHAPAVSALIHALYDLDCVAIVRRVYSASTAPRMGVLTPRIRADYEALEYTDIAYAEDMRLFTFPSLSLNSIAVGSSNGARAAAGTGETAPTVMQLQAVDRLMDNMQLMESEMAVKVESDAEEDEDDDGGNGDNNAGRGHCRELLKPKQTVNPYIQRLYQCVLHRAFDDSGSSPLPPVPSLMLNALQPPASVQERLQRDSTCLEQLQLLFPLKVVEPKKKVVASELFKDADEKESPAEKRARLDAPEEEASAMDLATLVGEEVNQVGSVDPVKDFQSMCRRGLQNEACLQLKKRILELVSESYHDQFYAKAMNCLKALRAECVSRAELVDKVYNDFLRVWKETLAGKGSKRMDFWEAIVAEMQGLISNVEQANSCVTAEEAAEFLKVNVPTEAAAAAVAEEDDEDVEDLLADMD